MDAWELADLEAARAARGVRYHEFISVPDLSGGLYVLEAGASDGQSPHGEDELYVVMEGRATVRVGDEDRPVGPGRSCSSRPGCPTGSTTSPNGSCSWSCSVRPSTPGQRASQRPAEGRAELGARDPTASWAEEHEGIVAGGQERLEASGPGARARRRSRPAQPQVQRPPIRRRVGASASSRSVATQAAPAAAAPCRSRPRPSWIDELDGQGHVARPRLEQPPQPLVVAARRRRGCATGRCPAAPRRPGMDRSGTGGPGPARPRRRAVRRRAGP